MRQSMIVLVLLCLTLTAFAQSSPVESLADPDGVFVEIDGVTLYYVERGDPDGEPILLLHGFAGSVADFFTMMPPLEDMGYRVIAFDRPPFGLADKSPDIDYTAASQAAWTVGLMDHLGIERATLLGHSAGGGLAAKVALTYPDRVTRLILVGASIDTWQGGGEPNPGTEVVAFVIGQAFNFNEDDARAQLRDYFTEERLNAYLQSNYYEPIELTPEIIQYSARWTQIPDWEAGLLAFARTFIMDNTGVSPEMTADISQPTLIVWGRDDILVPLRVGERLAETIPNKEFAVFDEAGHRVWDDAPEPFTSAVVQFMGLDQPAVMMAQIAAEWAGSECVPAVPELDFSAATTPDPDVSAQLIALSEADQADRSGDMPLDIAARDQARRETVMTMLQAGRVVTAEDFFHAGLIFQHGTCADHFRLATRLAEEANERGGAITSGLYAVTVDRTLTTQGQRQRFGTQYYEYEGRIVLYPTDYLTTDAEREDYMTATLLSALRRAAALNRQTEDE